MKMKSSESAKNNTRDMVLISLFTVLMAICAWISIPTVVPFTMQTFAVFLSVSVLGGKKGTLAICIYLLLGSIGIPVYAGGTAGIGILLGNTGGYMIGWIFSGLVMWGVEKLLGRKIWVSAISMVLGLVVCYALGTIWYMVVYAKRIGEIGLWAVLGWCVVPFIIPDLLKIALALFISKRITSIINVI